MRRLLTILGVLVMGLTLATPALAGHRDRSRGHNSRFVSPHHQRHVVGVYGGVYRPAYHYRPRLRSSFFFGFGIPAYAYGGYYAPAPYYCGHPAGFYPAPVWIPGHYVYEDGVRFYVRGYWSR